MSKLTCADDYTPEGGGLTPAEFERAKGARAAFLRLVNEHVGEYVAEAEHQDGLSYWLKFSSPGEAVDDLVTYLRVLGEEGCLQPNPTGSQP